MNLDYLEFEQPIVALQGRIDDLKRLASEDDAMNIAAEIQGLEEELEFTTQRIFSHLTSWQIATLARHPKRPHSLDYIEQLFTEFIPLQGDRLFADDPSIIGGLAKFENQSVMVIAHEKGRGLKQKMQRNFAMPKPEGYRKAARLMTLAERYNLPVITLIDTPGAYPGVDAEARGQSQAIANNLAIMSQLKTPIISIVIGEGGSGGALAIGVCDRLLMLQYSTYAVISPEGCASILWKSANYAQEAADAMGITADRLFELGLIDRIINEPAGGAHRNVQQMSEYLKIGIVEEITKLLALPLDELIQNRQNKLRSIGQFEK